MSRPGRPRGTLGAVAREFMALAERSGPITAPQAARQLQLSAREASSVAYELRAAGHLVVVPPPQSDKPSTGRVIWMSAPAEPGEHPLVRWLRDD